MDCGHVRPKGGKLQDGGTAHAVGGIEIHKQAAAEIIIHRLPEEKRKAQSEKAKAENKANEAKEEAKKAVEEKDEAEKKAQEAKTALTSAESKITEKQSEIDNLDKRITSKEAALDRLITETRTLRFEKYSDKSAGSDAWKDSLLIGFSNNMIKADETIRYCIHAIQDYAYSGFMCRGGGKHDCIFWPEEAHAIKKVMTSFAEAFKTTLHATSCNRRLACLDGQQIKQVQ